MTETSEFVVATHYERRDRDETTSLRVHGAIDLGEREHFGATLHEALLRPRTVVELELADVDFMDSAGIQLLLDARRAVHAVNARLVLIDPSRAVLRILQICCLTDLFDIAGRSVGQRLAVAET